VEQPGLLPLVPGSEIDRPRLASLRPHQPVDFASPSPPRASPAGQSRSQQAGGFDKQE